MITFGITGSSLAAHEFQNPSQKHYCFLVNQYVTNALIYRKTSVSHPMMFPDFWDRDWYIFQDKLLQDINGIFLFWSVASFCKDRK